MIFVLSIFSIFAFYTIFFTEDKYEKYILLMPVFILAIYTGTRFNVGGYDYSIYKYFYNLPYSQNPYGYESFFVFLRNFFKYIGFSYDYFLLVLAFVFNFAIYKLFVKYSYSPILSFFIYLSTFYYWHNFTIIRNFIAILIFWVSIKYIAEKKIIPYFILITIAYFFHKTAIMLYPLYFLLNLKFSKKSILILSSLAIFFNPLSFYIFKINLGFGLSERLNRYAYIVESGNIYEFIELFSLVFMLLFFIFIKKNISIENSIENIMINLNIIALFIFAVFFRFAIVLRVLEYFRIGFFITIPFILSKIENKTLKYLSFILFCLYFTWRHYDVVLGYGINNYQSWLFL